MLVDRPLLSYIEIRHANLLPPQLTVGKAQDLSPRYTTLDPLAPLRDTSTDLVSQNRRVHIPIGEREAPVQVAKLAAAESVNSSEVEVS